MASLRLIEGALTDLSRFPGKFDVDCSDPEHLHKFEFDSGAVFESVVGSKMMNSMM